MIMNIIKHLVWMQFPENICGTTKSIVPGGDMPLLVNLPPTFNSD